MAISIQPWTGKNPQWQQQEKSLQTNTPTTLINGTTVFRVTGGPILLQQLVSYCISANDATASLLTWSADGDVGAATAITGPTLTLASAIAGTCIVCSFSALNIVPAIAATGVSLSGTLATGIVIPAGIITTTVTVGSTTGTWLHFMHYTPMSPAAYVVTA
jgi:hypothetical protein